MKNFVKKFKSSKQYFQICRKIISNLQHVKTADLESHGRLLLEAVQLVLCAGTGAAQHDGQLRAESDGLVPRPVVVGGRQPSHPALTDDAVKQTLCTKYFDI